MPRHVSSVTESNQDMYKREQNRDREIKETGLHPLDTHLASSLYTNT